ncbi:MAG TPA: DoxX family protein [Polyangiales bacterium]
MNILLWILQAALAFLYLSGGAYKLFKFEELARQMQLLPHAGWRVLGALELVGGVLLIIPAATKWMPALTPIAAGVLALETLGLAALYARYSLKLAASNPLVWSAVMGLLVAFVAYGRYALSPSA